MSTPSVADARSCAANASCQINTARNAQLGTGESGDNETLNFLENELHNDTAGHTITFTTANN